MSQSKPAILQRGEPQLFVSELQRSYEFFVEKLGFAVVFRYGDPPTYAQVRRDGVRLNLRHLDNPVIDARLRERESLLSALIAVDVVDDLYEEFRAAGADFHQTLRLEPWGARDFILRDPDGNLILFASGAA